VIETGATAGSSVRWLAHETGWSLGWVAARLKEARERLQPDSAAAG
jgi:hypothetical protein